MKMKKYIYII